MEAPKSYTIRTETGELRLMSREEVGALVRTTMEKAKATPPSPKSPASSTSPRPRNPYTSTSQRLSRTPKRGARKFHFRLSPEAKKSNDAKQAAFVAESTSNSSKEKDLECRSERVTARSQNKTQRCPSHEDGMGAGDEHNMTAQELTKASNTEKPKGDVPKKNLSEVEIGDLVRNSIRRARENAKDKTPQQLAQAQKTVLANNEICSSPVAKQMFSWSSKEERRTHNESDLQNSLQRNEEPTIEGTGTELRLADEAPIEKLNPILNPVAIPLVNSIVEVDDKSEDVPSEQQVSPQNQPSVVSESHSQFSRVFRSFFHGPFQSRDQSDGKNELLNTQVTFETSKRAESNEKVVKDHLRVDIPSYSDVKDEQPSLNRIVQETMRRARETAEESVLDCGPFRDPCEVESGFDTSSIVSNQDMTKHDRTHTEDTSEGIVIGQSPTRSAPTTEVCAHEENSVIDAGDDGSNETRLTEALDISDVDSQLEDRSHQRSLQSSHGPYVGCCGVQSVLPSTAQEKEPEQTEPIALMTIHYDQTGKSLDKKPTVAKRGSDGSSVDPPEGECISNPKGPTLEEVVIHLMKSETTEDADSANLAPDSKEATPDNTEDESKVVDDKSKGNRPLLKLKVSCSSDEEYPTAREVRRSLSASLQQNTTKAMNRTRSVSDFNGAYRRARTLSSRSRRYRRSQRKSRDPSPQAQITDELLADLTKRKGKKITIDELKRMLKVPDSCSEDESRKEGKSMEHSVTRYTPNQLQPHIGDSTAISTHFCMDIWDLFQPFDDFRRLSDDECGPLEEYHSVADLESAAEDTTIVETTTFCDTDADAQPNPRMTFSFSARGGSTSSDDSTIIGW